ncbi:hypothetical protein MPLSOD_260010 [Mesorhizobium sp. SOD10]|nr:hypothetical protein MPLSOD_260010 [Mesorhizobium sp. SOD10]
MSDTTLTATPRGNRPRIAPGGMHEVGINRIRQLRNRSRTGLSNRVIGGPPQVPPPPGVMISTTSCSTLICQLVERQAP